MLVSLHWLKEFVELPEDLTPSQIGSALTMSTVEVEGIESLSAMFNQMVVGQIEELKPHPNADSLKIAITDIGKDKPIQIICGGTNLFVGMLVAVALPGAKVKWHGEGNLVTLQKAVIRGQESFGMICASDEINLEHLFTAQDKTVVNLSATEAKPGTPLDKLFGFDDVIIDIDNKSLTNRPDLWGHIGLARELAAIYDKKFKEPELSKFEKKHDQKIKIKIKASADCWRYLGTIVEQIEVGPSPTWLKKRLEALGQKSINNIVDLTNYVMFETGQPLHAFDLKNLNGQQIVVRRAVGGEKIVTLDESELKLDEETLVIADAKQPVALAGVMGGQLSGINQTTTSIVIESACFNPIVIRQAEKKYNLRTDSAIRFEKGIEPERAEQAMQRILFLLKKIQPQAKVGEVTDVYKKQNKPIDIKFSLNFVQNRLGIALDPKQVENILQRLGMEVKYKTNHFTVKPPAYRRLSDVTKPEDIVEEIARIYGYDKFNPVWPEVKLTAPQFSVSRQQEKKIKKLLAWGVGWHEVVNYSFTNQKIAQLGYDLSKMVSIKNSLSNEYTHLRPALLPGILNNVSANERWQKQFGLFELGRVFVSDQNSEFRRGGSLSGELVWQPYHLAGVVTGDKDKVFYQAKGVIETLNEFLKVTNSEWVDESNNVLASSEILTWKINGQIVGQVFRVADDKLKLLDINQAVGAWEIDFDLLVKMVTTDYHYLPLPKYPAVIFDLAIVFPQTVKWSRIQQIVRQSSKLVRSVELFDIYIGEQIGQGNKSIAFTLEFYHPDRTLTSTEVDVEVDKILKNLQQQLQGVLRSKN